MTFAQLLAQSLTNALYSALGMRSRSLHYTLYQLPLKPLREPKRTKALRPYSRYRWACKRAGKAYHEAIKLGLTRAQAVSLAAGAGRLL